MIRAVRNVGSPSAPGKPEGERLSKRVMQLRGCSRSEAEQTIEGGWVQVDGVVVEDPPFRVTSQQVVTVDPEATRLNLAPVTLILNKPPGYLDGVDGVESVKGAHAARKQDARSLLTPTHHFEKDASDTRVLKRHFTKLEASVPLETGASGLVVFTQDWRITRKLSEDLGTMEHEYLADVNGEVAGDMEAEAFGRIGRALNHPRNPLPPTKFSVSSSNAERSKLRFAIKGAHPGLIAYLCEQGGLEILALRRIRLGRVTLTDLPMGQWRYLASFEKF